MMDHFLGKCINLISRTNCFRGGMHLKGLIVKTCQAVCAWKLKKNSLFDKPTKNIFNLVNSEQQN